MRPIANRTLKNKRPTNDHMGVWLVVKYTRELHQKPIEQCSGQEIVQELLYHLGVPEAEINAFQKNQVWQFQSTCPLSLLTSCCVNQGSAIGYSKWLQNLAFIGNFAETERDTVLQQNIPFGLQWRLFISY